MIENNSFFDLLENVFDNEYWESSLSYLDKDIKQFSEIPKNLDIKIFLNKNIKNKLKAYCDKIDESEYTIVLGKNLLSALNLYINKEYNNDSLIFQDIPFDKEERSSFLIRNYMFEFIAIHEFVHIIRGHNEIKLLDNSYKVLGIDLVEIDADRCTSLLLAGKYLSIISKYGEEEYSFLIRNLIYAQLSLFEFRSTLKSDRDLKFEIISKSICTNGFVEAKFKNPFLIGLSLHEIQKMNDECNSNYSSTHNSSHSEIQSIPSLIYDVKKILKSYESFRKKYDLERRWQKVLSRVQL